jgi:predicted TIM-barrel fold metal-dependent hydrolase
MPVIDADTHIDEPEEAWQYMDGAAARFRPVTISPPEGVVPGGMDASASRWWLVDGRLRQRMIRNDELTGSTLNSRELLDVNERLQHMDDRGVDIHVIYPTFFLSYITGNPEAERALVDSWSRYVSSRCAPTEGRLRWVAVPPLLDIDAAVSYLRWAKENGAVGVFKRGLEHGRRVSDPYFFPLYEEASALDMPICIHTGNGNPTDARLGHGDSLGGIPIMDAFHALVLYEVPDKFPNIRWGFIEAGSTWIPYVVDRLKAEKKRRSWIRKFEMGENLFKRNKFFVAVDAVEDISYVLEYGTEDHLMMGTDYSHFDTSAEPDAIDAVRRWASEGRISDTVARKILEDNPKEFYGL